MAIENPRWGAKMMCGELLKLGISVHKRTVQRHMRKVRKRNSGQNWATFLRNHAQAISGHNTEKGTNEQSKILT